MKLPLEFVLQIHDDQINTYGGTPGVRDLAGLESALAQPWLEVFGTELHPFIDGNKRVAWACIETYLDIQGLQLEISDDDAYDLVGRIAQGDLEKQEIATHLERRLVSIVS